MGQLLALGFEVLLFIGAATGIWWPLTRQILDSPTSAFWAIPVGFIFTAISWWIARLVYGFVVGTPLALIGAWLLGGANSDHVAPPSATTRSYIPGSHSEDMPRFAPIGRHSTATVDDYAKVQSMTVTGELEQPSPIERRTVSASDLNNSHDLASELDARKPAAPWRRLLAFTIDLLAAVSISIGVGAALVPLNFSTATRVSLIFACVFVYNWLGNAFGGTLGHRLLGLRVTRASDSRNLGLALGLIRHIAFSIATAMLFLPHLIFLVRDRRAIQDTVVDSVVSRTHNAVRGVEPNPTIQPQAQGGSRMLLGAAFGLLLAAIACGAGGGTAWYIINQSDSDEPMEASAPLPSSPSEKPATPTSEPATVRAPTATLIPPGLAAELQQIDSLGFYVPDTSTYQPDGRLHALIGISKGGRAQQAFFYVESRYLGTDLADVSAGISFAWQTSDTVALNYLLFVPSDPMCCPTGGSALVRYYWGGASLVPLDWVPPAGFDAPLSRR
jgi:uncharacterized RDD family membrane protein YckC